MSVYIIRIKTKERKERWFAVIARDLRRAYEIVKEKYGIKLEREVDRYVWIMSPEQESVIELI